MSTAEKIQVKHTDAATSSGNSAQSSAHTEYDGRLPEYDDYEKVLVDLFRWKER